MALWHSWIELADLWFMRCENDTLNFKPLCREYSRIYPLYTLAWSYILGNGDESKAPEVTIEFALIYPLDQYRDGSTCVSLWHLFLFTFAICVRSCAVHIPITRPKRKWVKVSICKVWQFLSPKLFLVSSDLTGGSYTLWQTWQRKTRCILRWFPCGNEDTQFCRNQLDGYFNTLIFCP